jgi:hypothetical protein
VIPSSANLWQLCKCTGQEAAGMRTWVLIYQASPDLSGHSVLRLAKEMSTYKVRESSIWPSPREKKKVSGELKP